MRKLQGARAPVIHSCPCQRYYYCDILSNAAAVNYTGL